MLRHYKVGHGVPCPIGLRRGKPRYRDADNGQLKVKIGILAVQGDFAAHAAMLAGLGAETVEVRAVGDLDGCDGLDFAWR